MADRTIRVRLLAEVAGFKQAMKDARTETEKTAHQFDKDGKAIETRSGQLVRSAEVQREAWSTAGTTLAGFGTAGVIAFGAATKAAIDWESAWTGVLKTVDGTHDQLAALEGDLRTMATTLPATHGEIAAVAEAAGQLGVQVENVAAFTKVMIDLGETTNLTSDEAATSLAQLMNIMHTAPGDVDNLGAAVVALGNNGASTERDIVQMAQRIAGAGATIGLTEGDVLGLANALASAGIEVEAGGSAISNIMIDIAKAVSSNTPELQEWARVAGMSAEQFSEAWRSDPTAALDSFVKGLGRANAAGEDVFGTLETLGQSDVRVTRALLSMANAGDLLAGSIELGNKAFEDNEALVAEAEKRYDTTAAKLEIARNSIHDAAISIGDTLLPALAGLAEGVAAVTSWFANLPGPLQEGIGVIGGVASVALLAAGGFLSLAPRIADTVKAMDMLRASSNPAAVGVTKVAGAAGKASIALLAVTAATAALNAAMAATRPDSIGINEITRSLLEMADGAEVANTALGGLVDPSGAAEFWNFSSVEYATDLAGAFKNLDYASSGWWAQVRTGLADWSGLNDAMDVSREVVGGIDTSLADLVRSGDITKASELLDALSSDTGISRRNLRAQLPEYRDALAEVSNEQTIAATSAEQLAAAEAVLSEEQQKVIDQWKDMAGVANASFINIGDAYQQVIDKNIELAQASADATESTEDSWKNFYDGLTVDSQSFIKQLEAQVEAQLSWQEDMFALADRIDGLDAGSRDEAQQMIDELIGQGVQSAPLVQMLADVSDEEFQRIVDLWGNKGTEATEEFTSAIAEALGVTEPVALPVDADMTAATATVNKWFAQFGADVPAALKPGYARQMAYDERHQGFAGGGGVWGAGTGTSDSIPAWLSNGEYVQTAAAHRFWGTSTMDAMRRRDVGEVLAAASRMARRGYAEGGPVAYPSQAPQYLPAQVVTVPVESRFESHSPVEFTGDIQVNDYESLMREARAARRLAGLGGNRG